MKRKLLTMLCLCSFVIGQNVLAQAADEITASGVVKDANGEALMGVMVAAEGTSIRAVTKLDGDFTLSVPQGATLQFSYMGFQPQTLPAAAGMNVILQEEDAVVTKEVEVVAIGYGNARKKDLTGAMTSVGPDDMKKGVITSPTQLLQSKVAGLTVVQGSGDPTSGAMMRLRGGSSLSGNNDPLVVVDGIAGVDPNTVQPSDIVSMDVLKDASASAIYGSRGANGVILITTNRKSETAERVSAEYSGYFSVAKASKQLDLLTAANWDSQKTGITGVQNYGANTNWQDEIQRTALTHSHAVTFSGASNKSGFKGSISYLNSEGVIKSNQMERIGASVSGYTKVWDDRLTLEAGVHANRDNYSQIDNRKLFKAAYSLNPTLPVKWGADNLYGTEGEYAQDPKAGDISRYVNPIEYLDNRQNDKKRDRYLTFAKADLRIIKGLNASINLARNQVVTNDGLYVNIGSKELEAQNYKGYATRAFGDWAEQTLEGFLTYDTEFKKLHRLNIMGGGSYAVAFYEGSGSGKYNFPSDDFLYNNMEAGSELQYLYSSKNKTQLLAYFGRVNYSFSSKYMFTATLRADGTSKFAKAHKWGLFPSASVAWRITNEKFMSGTRNWLNDLKLRVGYGVTGNQGGIDPYTSMPLWATSKHLGSIPVIYEDVLDDDGEPTGEKRVKVGPIQNENPDLKWESTGQLNVGLDFELFKNRLYGTVEFYHKNTKDLLYFYDLGYTGENQYSKQLMNIGNMTNTGVELTLNSTIVKGKDYALSANLNLSHNVNKVVKISDPRFQNTKFDAGYFPGVDGWQNYPTQQIKEGYSIGSFFGAKYYGKDENGKLLYERTIDGVLTTTEDINEADKVYLGNAMPKLTLGFGLSFTYKKWDASVNTYGMFGQKIYNATSMDLYNTNARDNLNVMSDWTTGNQKLGVSDYWLEDGSFFRLQNITIGYTFDLKRIKMNSLRIYVTAENLFVFTAYSGVDPEVSIDIAVTKELEDGDYEQAKRFPGIDNYNNYPKPRNFIVGLNLKF